MSKKNKRAKTMSCGALAWRTVDGRQEILLIKQFQHRDNWGIPKGHINEGETPEECALRETREETGVTVKLGTKLTPVVAHLKKEDKTVVTYLAEPVSGEPQCNDPDCEVADVRWFDVQKLPKLQEYQKSIIDEALELLAIVDIQ